MKHLKYTLILILLGGLFAGCEQEVVLDLQEEDKRVVIEGWVNDKDDTYLVKLTYSGSFFGEPEMDYITGADVRIRDDQGQSETLREISPGLFETRNFRAQQLTTLTLEADVEGVTYTASDRMPRIGDFNYVIPVYIDTLIFGEGYYILVSAVEPEGTGDNYQFRIYRNDSLFDSPNDFFIIDDRVADGTEALFLYPYPHESGDTVVIEVRAISDQTYDYYLTYFNQVNSGGGGPFGSPPDNLLTNFDNGGLGYFGAVGLVRDTIIIP